MEKEVLRVLWTPQRRVQSALASNASLRLIFFEKGNLGPENIRNTIGEMRDIVGY